ncbi:MAG: hypothetical protein M0P61_03820 [Ignavibacteriaceae bacterium]|jgi:hypothetical protein|nr:hypothetical protein [Ignavibacteriaceae bacterium]
MYEIKTVNCSCDSFFLSLPLFAQQNSNTWRKSDNLIGNWKGEGSGKPGQGEGTFSFKLDLDKNILVRTSHSEYPATKDKPAGVHNDLMIIYRDYTGIPDKAIYFDNENHVINYSITYSGKKNIVFTSDKIPNAPRFRLTYTIMDDVTVNTKFEISKDGENFFTYIEGESKRIK